MNPELPVLRPNPLVDPDEGLEYLSMPKGMQTFEIPMLPEAEVIARYPEALQALQQVQEALACLQGPAAAVDLALRTPLDHLPEPAIALLYQVLGEGEMSIRIESAPPIRIQETVLAGVWWLQQLDADGRLASQWLEVGSIPQPVRERAFREARLPDAQPDLPAGLDNAGPVLVELLEAARQRQQQPEQAAHVINLSLLPFSPADHRWLDLQLGHGPLVMLSRGYGNCRISATGVPEIWRVQYFNSTDQLILDTLEVTSVPQVAFAAREDLEDSAERLQEMREVLQ